MTVIDDNTTFKYPETAIIADEFFNLYDDSLGRDACFLDMYSDYHAFQQWGAWELQENEDAPETWDEQYTLDVHDNVTIYMDRVYDLGDRPMNYSRHSAKKYIALDRLYHLRGRLDFVNVAQLYAKMLTGEYNYDAFLFAHELEAANDTTMARANAATITNLPTVHYIKSIGAYLIGDGNHRIHAFRLFQDRQLYDEFINLKPNVLALLNKHWLDTMKWNNIDAAFNSLHYFKPPLNVLCNVYTNPSVDNAMTWWQMNQRQ